MFLLFKVWNLALPFLNDGGMTVLQRCWPVTDAARASVLSASTWKVEPFDFGLQGGEDVKPSLDGS